jgi:hypothetical protein
MEFLVRPAFTSDHCVGVIDDQNFLGIVRGRSDPSKFVFFTGEIPKAPHNIFSLTCRVGNQVGRIHPELTPKEGCDSGLVLVRFVVVDSSPAANLSYINDGTWFKIFMDDKGLRHANSKLSFDNPAVASKAFLTDSVFSCDFSVSKFVGKSKLPSTKESKRPAAKVAGPLPEVVAVEDNQSAVSMESDQGVAETQNILFKKAKNWVLSGEHQIIAAYTVHDSATYKDGNLSVELRKGDVVLHEVDPAEYVDVPELEQPLFHIAQVGGFIMDDDSKYQDRDELHDQNGSKRMKKQAAAKKVKKAILKFFQGFPEATRGRITTRPRVVDVDNHLGSVVQTDVIYCLSLTALVKKLEFLDEYDADTMAEVGPDNLPNHVFVYQEMNDASFPYGRGGERRIFVQARVDLSELFEQVTAYLANIPQ